MRLQSALDRSCDTGRSTSYELESLGHQLAEAAGALSGLAGQLSVLDKLDEELDLDGSDEAASRIDASWDIEQEPHHAGSHPGHHPEHERQALIGETQAAAATEYPANPPESTTNPVDGAFPASPGAAGQPDTGLGTSAPDPKAQVEFPEVRPLELFEFGTPEDLDEPTP